MLKKIGSFFNWSSKPTSADTPEKPQVICATQEDSPSHRRGNRMSTINLKHLLTDQDELEW